MRAPAIRRPVGFGLEWSVFPLGLLAAILGAAAVVLPVAALAIAVGLLFATIAFRDLGAGLALFAVLMFFEEIPGVASSGLTLVKVGGAVLTLAWLAHLAGGRRGESPPFLLRDRPGVAFFAIGLFALAASSTLWALDDGTARNSALRLGQGIVLVFIVYTALCEPRSFRWLLWAFVGGAFLSAVIGMAGTPPDTFNEDAAGRLGDGIRDPNQLAAILVPALVISAFAIAAVGRALPRLLLLTTACVCAVGIFMTESRGGLVALGAAALGALVLAGPLRPQAVAVILMVGAFGLSYYTLIAPPEALQRITHFTAEGGTGRTDLWSVALEMSADKPALGVGAGNFQVVEPSYAANTINITRADFVLDEPDVAHNTYLHILAELGAVGLALFATVVLSALLLAWGAARRFAQQGARDLEILTRGFVVGLFGMLVAYVFISAQYEKQLWLLLGTALGLSGLALRTGARRSPPLESS